MGSYLFLSPPFVGSLFGNFCGFNPFALPPRRIVKSRRGEANEVQCFREICVWRAPEVSRSRRHACAAPRRLALDGLFRSGPVLCGPMRSQGVDSTDREIPSSFRKPPTQPRPNSFVCRAPGVAPTRTTSQSLQTLERPKTERSGLPALSTPHRSLDLNEEKKPMELKNFEHRTFKISGYRTLSL